MFPVEMVSVLCCPSCRSGDLHPEIQQQKNSLFEEGWLLCRECDIRYEVHAGVPNLVPPSVDSSDEWQIWKKHLNGFNTRRQDRKSETIKLPHLSGKETHKAFFEFAKINDGTVLDVGCGPGKLRAYLDEDRVTYYGLDPLPMEETQNFRFVNGLGEHIPFQASTFSHMLVISALDHFNDLDRFFCEAKRVLRNDGGLHILQSVHEIRGVISLVKMLGHWAKDLLDSSTVRSKCSDVPKHMSEFSKSSLMDVARRYFNVVKVKEFSQKWYSPQRLFISLRPNSSTGEPGVSARMEKQHEYEDSNVRWTG